MSANPERRGLGRGLGELFQRTDLAERQPDAAAPGTDPNRTQTRTTDAGLNQGGSEGSGPLDPTLLNPDPTPLDPTPLNPTPLHPNPPGSFFAELPLGSITPNPRQPRTVFDEEALEELVGSLREVGLLQPVVVRPLGDQRYELVMGERRWRAAQQAGLEVIPAIVRETEEHDLLRDALLENLHRAQLNPLEEGAAYQQMLDDFGCTQDELAARIKRSRPQISNMIRLLRLPPTVQRRVAAGVLSAGHARALLAVTDPGGQERLAQRVVAEGLSVRAVEELVTLGETGRDGDPVRRHRSSPVSPQAAELAGRLSDHLETRVKVEVGRTKGKISIEFASAEDLDRIVTLLHLPE